MPASVAAPVAAGRACRSPSTAQKVHARVHTSPRIRNVAVPEAKHSPLLGQRASRADGVELELVEQGAGGAVLPRRRRLVLEPRRLAAAADGRRPAARLPLRGLGRGHSEAVDAAPDAAQRGLADRLGERRVRVDGGGDVGEREAGVDRQGELVHELGDVRSDQAGAEHRAAAGLADDAHEAVGVAVARRPWSCR